MSTIAKGERIQFGGNGAPSPVASSIARPSVLSLNIKERAALYAAYMPYLKNGGIFVPTVRPYNLGDSVYLLLSLLDDSTKFPIAGKVAWITPPGAHQNKSQGIGVHFSPDEAGATARRHIEDMLSGTLKSARITHTL